MLPAARFMFESGSSLEKLVLSGGIEPQKRDGLLETVGLGAYAGGIEIRETPECVDGDAARRCCVNGLPRRANKERPSSRFFVAFLSRGRAGHSCAVL